MTLTKEAKVETEVSPKVFCADEAHVFLNWIAEGTDGFLYWVPSAPGGWKERHRYEGHVEELKAVSPQKARAITAFVGGTCKEWGPVTIAEISTREYWTAPQDNTRAIV